MNHPYKRNWHLTHCNEKEELRTRPRPHPVTTTNILKSVAKYGTWLGVGNTLVQEVIHPKLVA
jgi:hypothetical protein